MKRIISLLILLCLSLSARAQVITATVTATSGSGTVNGNNIVVNGTTRTFTNTVSIVASQILNGTNVGSTASNIFNAYLITRENNLTVSQPTTSTVQFKGFPGAALTLTIGGGWGTVSFSTNGEADSTYVRVPMSNAGNSERTSVESGLVDYLNDSLGANIIATNAPFFISLVNTNGNQQISGAKTFNGSINGIVGNLTNGTWTNPSFTNGQNFGNPFRSPGGGIGSEQFGLGASATADGAIAFGDGATANGVQSVVMGTSATASGSEHSVIIGNTATGGGDDVVAVGFNALASGDSSTALGVGTSTAGHVFSTAIGAGSANTADHQIMMGTVVEYTHFAGGVLFTGVETNFTGAGTNIITGQLAFTRKNITTLVNGAPNLVSTSTNLFLKLSGPTGAFTVNAMDGGADGRVVILYNITGQTMTVANNSGALGVAANRILTGTGADVVGVYAATFIYDSAQSLWVMISKN